MLGTYVLTHSHSSEKRAVLRPGTQGVGGLHVDLHWAPGRHGICSSRAGNPEECWMSWVRQPG